MGGAFLFGASRFGICYYSVECDSIHMVEIGEIVPNDKGVFKWDQ